MLIGHHSFQQRPARLGIAMKWRSGRYPRMALLMLPFLFLLRCNLTALGDPNMAEQMVGIFTLLFVPGYAVLRSLGLDPIAGNAPGYRWPLVVPLSLAIDMLLGMLLVLTPLGLSACSIWAGLSMVALAPLLKARWL